MQDPAFARWLATTPPIVIGALVFASMVAALFVGIAVRNRLARGRDDEDASSEEGYIVSATLGLLALLLAFTFSVALDRFETRRQLVITEANAIGTSYLRAQLLDEPHRSRLSALLVAYVDNRIALGEAKTDTQRLLATNDALLTRIWAAVAAAAPSANARGMVVPLNQTFNQLIDLDTERKVARLARVPSEVFVVLFLYLVMTAGMLGFVLEDSRRRAAAGVLFVLMTVSITLIVDLNGPVSGMVVESQEPMRMLQRSLAAQPPAAFERYREAGPRPSV